MSPWSGIGGVKIVFNNRLKDSVNMSCRYGYGARVGAVLGMGYHGCYLVIVSPNNTQVTSVKFKSNVEQGKNRKKRNILKSNF